MDELRRRTFLALLGAPLLAALLESCADDEVIAAETGSARSAVSRSRASAADGTAAATAVNDFGMSLYRQLAEVDGTRNLVVSPASIAIALTATAAGARGATLEEMAATLHIADIDTIHHSMNALTTQLRTSSDDDVRLSLVNSLWGQVDVAFAQPFLDLLASEYGAGMELVDFHSGAESARLAINQWVSERTRQRIPEVVRPDVLGRDMKLVVASAISLNATWAQQFDVALTADAPFTTAAGDVVHVPAMTRMGRLAYATGDGWRAVELPYDHSSLAMLIFAPEDGFLRLFEQIFLVTDATEYLEPRQVRLQLPRFDIESSFSLQDQLAALGMTTAFTEDADFRGMTDEADLHIDEVAHQATIGVTEAGTEAAATTAVLDKASAAPLDEPVDFVIDRPFVFVVRDTASQAVLIMGRVSDPRG